MACEGALLADAVVRGKSTANYTRGQADALRVQASNLADALATRPALASIEKKVRAKARQASALSSSLERLRDHPSDARAAATTERRLRRLGGCP